MSRREGTRLFVQRGKIECERRINGFALGFKRNIRYERPVTFMPNIKPVLLLLVFAYREHRRAVLLWFWVSVILIENVNLPAGKGDAAHFTVPLVGVQ